VAGGLADFLRSARRYYPRVRPHELKITVLQDAERLLLELPDALGRAAARSLCQRGVGVRLKARAAQVSDAGVMLADGEFIAAATVICTIGTRANPFVEQLDVPRQRGRIEAAFDLSVPGRPGVWAIGDCALVRNAGAELAPPTAQFAVAEARTLARNVLAAIEGRPTQPFSHRSRGMMATTGHLKGVALVGPLGFSGLAAWLLWRAYYLLLMPTLGRKLRIWVEWTWSMFFAADITHLRFTRTAEADAEATAPSTTGQTP
jgi:NADH dehydrogenase